MGKIFDTIRVAKDDEIAIKKKSQHYSYSVKNICLFCKLLFYRANIIQHYRNCPERTKCLKRNIDQQNLEIFLYIFNIENVPKIWNDINKMFYPLNPKFDIENKKYQLYWESKGVDLNIAENKKFAYRCYKSIQQIKYHYWLSDKSLHFLPFFASDYIRDNAYQIYFDEPNIIKEYYQYTFLKLHSMTWYWDAVECFDSIEWDISDINRLEDFWGIDGIYDEPECHFKWNDYPN